MLLEYFYFHRFARHDYIVVRKETMLIREFVDIDICVKSKRKREHN
jgi:hypothetical protein